MRHVGHGLGLEGVDGPQEGDRQSDPVGRFSDRSGQACPAQRATGYAEQGEAGEEVNRTVDQVVAEYVEPPYRVVGRKTELPDGAGRPTEEARNAIQRTDVRLVLDPTAVVVHEFGFEAVRVDGGSREHDDQRCESAERDAGPGVHRRGKGSPAP